MSSSSYWSSEIDKLLNGVPKGSGSYYNQSFVDKINEAQASIDNLVSEKDKAWGASQQSMDEYNTFQGSMKSYSDMYKSSEDEFGVKQAKDTYESNKQALAMAQTTLDALPSSINAASNRVMTQSQREKAYNVLSDRWARTISMQTQQNSAYEQAWKNAREKMSADISMQMAEQQSKLSGYNDKWIESTNKFNQIGENLISAKDDKYAWEEQYRAWQRQQWNNDYTIWSNQLSTANARYIQEVKNEMAELQANLTKLMSDSNARIAAIKQR